MRILKYLPLLMALSGCSTLDGFLGSKTEVSESKPVEVTARVLVQVCNIQTDSILNAGYVTVSDDGDTYKSLILKADTEAVGSKKFFEQLFTDRPNVLIVYDQRTRFVYQIPKQVDTGWSEWSRPDTVTTGANLMYKVLSTNKDFKLVSKSKNAPLIRYRMFYGDTMAQVVKTSSGCN